VDASGTRFAAGINAVSEELNVRIAAIKLHKVLGNLDTRVWTGGRP
jgi:hypothetical protein